VSQPFGNQPTTPLGGGPAPAGAFAQQPYAPPPRKSNWWVWLLGGCGCSAVLLVLCCGGFSYWGFSKATGVIGDQLKKEVADNADVKENLGEIQSISMNLMETAEEKKNRNDTSNWMVFDATGSEGDGKFIAEMPPGGQGGSPFGKIELRTEDGKTIQIK
jgi:hypothetical protein